MHEFLFEAGTSKICTVFYSEDVLASQVGRGVMSPRLPLSEAGEYFRGPRGVEIGLSLPHLSTQVQRMHVDGTVEAHCACIYYCC